MNRLVRNLRIAKEKCLLRPGDTVVMVDCLEAEKYKGRLWTIDSMPWLCCGNILIKLEGYTGGFDASCLQKVAPIKEVVNTHPRKAAIAGV